MNTNIFDKILYGIKTTNDNIVTINEKVDAIISFLTYEDTEPNDISGAEETVGDTTNQIC